MNIVDDLLAARDRIDDAIKALMALGIKPTAPVETAVPTAPKREQSKIDLSKLSEKEREVLDLLKQDLDTREIAEKLGRGKKTVESQRDNIRKILGIESARELQRMIDKKLI